MKKCSSHPDQVDFLSLTTSLRAWAIRTNSHSGLSLSQKEQINQKLRLFSVLLQNSQRQFANMPNNWHVERDHVLAELDQNAGKIPSVINPSSQVHLPQTEYLPEKMKPSQHRTIPETVEKWQMTPWDNPGRNTKQKVGFISDTEGVCSVRAQLKADGAIVVAGEERFLSMADIQYFQTGNIDADHMQSSSEILARQMDIVAAMNLDPEFKRKIEQTAGECIKVKINAAGKVTLHHMPSNTRGFFMEDQHGNIYGTKYFYMFFHNCMENLWLLNHHLNSGTGKSNAEAMEWLALNAMFGDDFFRVIAHHPPANGNIDKDSLMLCLQRDSSVDPDFKAGMLLADVAKLYFKKTKMHIVNSEHHTQQLAQAMRDSFKQAVARGGRKYMHSVKMALADKVFNSAFPDEVKQAVSKRHYEEHAGFDLLTGYQESQAKRQRTVHSPAHFSQSASEVSDGVMPQADFERGLAAVMQSGNFHWQFHSLAHRALQDAQRPLLHDTIRASLERSYRDMLTILPAVPPIERPQMFHTVWCLQSLLEGAPMPPSYQALASQASSPVILAQSQAAAATSSPLSPASSPGSP